MEVEKWLAKIGGNYWGAVKLGPARTPPGPSPKNPYVIFRVFWAEIQPFLKSLILVLSLNINRRPMADKNLSSRDPNST